MTETRMALKRALDDLANLSLILAAEERGREVAESNNEEPFGYYITEIDSDGDSLSFFSKVHPSKRYSHRRLLNYVTLVASE